MIKLFEEFNNEQNIHDICKEYNIQNYTINDDGSIDVNGNVDLRNKDLEKIPLRFNKVEGFFNCSNNKLTSLEGCPNYVGGYFKCYINMLNSLKGSPDYIKDDFDCSDNQLTSLKYCPVYIDYDLICSNNPINKIDVECDIKGVIYLMNTKINETIINLSNHYKRMLFKYGLDYKIFNNDGSINDNQLQHFLNDFKE